MEEFEIENGKLTRYNGNGGDVTVPDGVTVIADRVFRGHKELTGITLPEGVTELWPFSFCGCRNLRRAVLPKGLHTIGGQAFDSCESLVSVVLSDGLHTIESGAFHKCTSLRELTLPDSLRVIDLLAFSQCRSLEVINIPEKATEIYGEIFRGCESLTEIRVERKYPKEIWKTLDKVQYCSNRLRARLPLSNREKRFASFFFREIAGKLIAAEDVQALHTLFAMRKAVREDWLEEWIAESGESVAVRAYLLEYKHRRHTVGGTADADEL